jgi:hypothetical protein
VITVVAVLRSYAITGAITDAITGSRSSSLSFMLC